MPLPQATADKVVQDAKDCPLLRARRVKVAGSFDVALDTSPRRVPHPLGAVPSGVIVTRQTVAGQVLTRDPSAVSPAADPMREIVLEATAAMTVQLLLF